MRINGKTYNLPTQQVIFQRGDEFIAFTLKGLTSLDEFNQLVNRPTPPMIVEIGKPPRQDLTDPNFIKAFAEYSEYQIEYLVIKALEATEGLTWDKVNLNDVTTWKNWRQELADFGLTHYEIEQVGTAAIQVHGASGQTKEIRDAFLSRLATQLKAGDSAPSSPAAGQESIAFSERVSV